MAPFCLDALSSRPVVLVDREKNELHKAWAEFLELQRSKQSSLVEGEGEKKQKAHVKADIFT